MTWIERMSPRRQRRPTETAALFNCPQLILSLIFVS